MNEDDKIRLWTFQDKAVFDMVMEKGVGYCTLDGYMAKDFPDAYRWMHLQMKRRIGEPEIEGVESSIWAWRYFDGKAKPKPRRVIDSFDNDCQQQVFMELLIPQSRVLLSDFDLWNIVLIKEEIDLQDGLPMEETWERIFDPDFNHPEWCVAPWDERCIQANLWCIHKEDIVYADLLQKQEGKRALLKQRIYGQRR